MTPEEATKTMTAAEAAAIIGGCGDRQRIANTQRALSFHAWRNTPEENERLDAATFALKNWKAFSAEDQARHETRFARRISK